MIATDLPVCSVRGTSECPRFQPAEAAYRKNTGEESIEKTAPVVHRLNSYATVPDDEISYRVVASWWFDCLVGKTREASLTSKEMLLRVIGMVANITERKLAEEALRESEEKFRSVFRDAGVGMVIVSPEGRFLAANGTFCDCLGYTEEELLAKTVESVTFPEDWPAFSASWGGHHRGDRSLAV